MAAITLQIVVGTAREQTRLWDQVDKLAEGPLQPAVSLQPIPQLEFLNGNSPQPSHFYHFLITFRKSKLKLI